MNIEVMSEIAEIVDHLEIKIVKLLSKLDNLEQISKHSKEELKQSIIVIKNQSEEIEILKTNYNALKIANSLLGSEDNKRDTKLKINSLIREIDYCIAQLSD